MKTICHNMMRAIVPVMLGIAAATSQALAQTPSALWTFDQGSGTTANDTSGNNRHATLTGAGATWTSSSRVGPFALSLSGTSFATATSAAVNTANSFTACAWVRINSLNAFHGILSKDANNVSAFFLEYNSGIQRFSFARFASDSTSAAVSSANATAAPVVGTWYHVAGVHNATADTLALYVNGVLQQTVAYSSGWQSSGSTIIGRTRWNATPLSYLQGAIDDARLYASALTTSQIQALANVPPPNNPDFTLSVSPNTISIAQGANGTRTVTINRLNGFTGSVGFTASGMPSGVSAVFNPSSTTGNSSTLTLAVSPTSPTGNSTITITGTSGSLVRSTTLALTITTSGGGGSYTWPTYSPNLNYDFRNDFGTVPMPTQVLNDCANVTATVSSQWWCFRYGPNRNSLVTSAAWTPMLARFNTDFGYYRDTMGWPPDLRARSGFRSAIYLYGSGLCTDNAPNTATGGWQSSIFFNGQNWPMALLSYYPVYSFDPACPFSDRINQQGASVHEGIHCILASLPGARNACWYHEGGNTWLQGEATARQTGNYSSLGFLSAGSMLAPFMPIECYSGWLQDGSFGGPCAEGVDHGAGVCSWRNLLGGVQYSETFSHFMGEAVSPGSVAWIWRYCTNRVLQGLAEAPGGLGATQTRRLITEYRARQAMCDFGVWSGAYRALLNNNWGITIDQEFSPFWIDCAAWTARCYVVTTNSSGTLRPETRTLPGWSGANQIPLTVNGASGGTISVTFNPIGANMSCQLVYRATDNTIVYSAPVTSGTCSLTLPKAVKNNVVIAVVCNTDYIYNGESTRTAHFDYRLVMGSNVTGAANIATQWYNP